MDIAAHALWAGAGALLVRRHFDMEPRTVVATIVLAAAPALVQFLPLLAWVLFGDGTTQALQAYALAIPGHEPPMPGWVVLVSHHLHCTMHSAIVAGAATLSSWLLVRSIWFPLWGWWSHILIDVPTHSADFYPSPVLYPLSERSFDGIAWNTPWFNVVNYAAIAAVWIFLLWSRRRET
jgi:hypothetical protein